MLKLPHVMLDIETIGLSTDAVVTEIAVVEFDIYGNEKGEELQLDIDILSSLLQGDKIEEETVEWRRKYAPLFESKTCLSLNKALTELARFLHTKDNKGPAQIWCQGPDIDFAILREKYRRAGIPLPWEFHAQCDARTVRRLAKDSGWIPLDIPKQHTALSDCHAQIKELCSAWEYLSS